MISRLFFFLIIGLFTASAEPIDARDNIILPANPPRSKSSKEDPSGWLMSKSANDQRQELAKTKAELKSALDSGLGEKHPTVQALIAKLAAIQEQPLLPDQNQSEESEIAKLQSEMAAMKSELEQLRQEVSELKNQK